MQDTGNKGEGERSVFTYVIADETRSFRSIAQKIQARRKFTLPLTSYLLPQKSHPKGWLFIHVVTQKIQAKDDSEGGVVTLSPYGASSSTATRSPFPSLGKAMLRAWAGVLCLCR